MHTDPTTTTSTPVSDKPGKVTSLSAAVEMSVCP